MITTRRAALLVVIGESLITPVLILPILLFDNFAPTMASVPIRTLLAGQVTVVGATAAFFLYVYHANGEIPYRLGLRVAALVAAGGLIALRTFLFWSRIGPPGTSRLPDFVGALALAAFFIAAAWKSASSGPLPVLRIAVPVAIVGQALSVPSALGSVIQQGTTLLQDIAHPVVQVLPQPGLDMRSMYILFLVNSVIWLYSVLAMLLFLLVMWRKRAKSDPMAAPELGLASQG